MQASGIQWWCAAQTAPWTWTWRAYPGVWLLVLSIGAAYWLTVRRVGASPDAPPPDRRHVRWFVAGLVTLWVALDWPVGALGAGYLAAVHMVQYLLIAIVAPPMLLKGIPPFVIDRLRGGGFERVLRLLTHPLVAFGLFNVVLVFTHLPATVDTWMRSQVGSFGIDMLWLFAGLVFWWPVIVPVPEREWFSAPLKMGYLFLTMVSNTLPFAVLTYAELPFYSIYELSPPFPGLSARGDQQIAGILMKVGGAVILWTVITVMFFRWYNEEERADDAGRPGARA